jgi:hypothetical protein
MSIAAIPIGYQDIKLIAIIKIKCKNPYSCIREITKSIPT